MSTYSAWGLANIQNLSELAMVHRLDDNTHHGIHAHLGAQSFLMHQAVERLNFLFMSLVTEMLHEQRGETLLLSHHVWRYICGDAAQARQIQIIILRQYTTGSHMSAR